MISLPSRRALPLVTAAALWLFPTLPVHSQEPVAPGTPQPLASGAPASPTVNPLPYETRPLQVVAACPEKAKSVLKADKTYDRFRWFQGNVATTLENGRPVAKPIEMPGWMNCSEIEVAGPGDWSVVMSKDGFPDVIVPFKVTAHKKPEFTLAGVPTDQVRPRSEVILTITPSSGTEYKTYRLYESRSEFGQLTSASTGSSTAGGGAAAPASGGSGSLKKGEDCSKFEASKNVKSAPSDPAAVIAYLGARSRQAKEQATEFGQTFEKLEREILRLQGEVQAMETELARIPVPTEEQKKALEDKKNLLKGKRTERDNALQEKARLQREGEFFDLYEKQATDLLEQIDDAENDLFEATSALRNDSSLPMDKRPGENPHIRKLSTRERARFKRTIQESEERIASLWGGIAAFAGAEPGMPGLVPVQTGIAPDTKIRVTPGTKTFYRVEITDANGCVTSREARIDVRKLTVDLILGTQFSTYNVDEVLPMGMGTGMGMGMGMDGNMIDEEDRRAFNQQVVVAGARFRHAFSDYVEGYGEIGFGGLNIEVPAMGQPGSDPLPEDVVRDAQVVEFELGTRYALLEAWCTAEWIPKFLCNQLTGEQIKLELNGRYGFSLITEDELDTDVVLADRGDFLDKWFLGFSIRNDNPGHVLDESYIELGWGRSDNFADNDDRFKANALLLVDLGATVWDLFLEGRFDADRGNGSDDLRVTIGFQREMTSFLRTLFGMQNP